MSREGGRMHAQRDLRFGAVLGHKNPSDRYESSPPAQAV
jgi:hypothetical protein